MAQCSSRSVLLASDLDFDLFDRVCLSLLASDHKLQPFGFHFNLSVSLGVVSTIRPPGAVVQLGLPLALSLAAAACRLLLCSFRNILAGCELEAAGGGSLIRLTWR